MTSRAHFGLLGSVLAVLAGCTTTVEPYMAPTPVSFKLERIDFVPHVAPELRAARPPVFYARTRALAEAGEAGYYRDARDQHLRLGGARGKCWSFPPDYERCLEEALLGQFPQLRRAR